jgi:hypothetical protein
MLNRRAEPGGDQQRAELVAVQGAGMGLIVQPRPPEVGRWGVLEELLFGGVAVKAGDGAQPPGDGGAGAATCFQVAGEAFDVGPTDGEQVQGADAAPGGAEVSGGCRAHSSQFWGRESAALSVAVPAMRQPGLQNRPHVGWRGPRLLRVRPG